MQNLLKSLTSAIVLSSALGLGGPLTLEVRGESAEQILKANGISGGLVVHVGCGDGKLTADFGKLDGFLVHGLERSEAKIAAAREHVEDLGLYGKVL